VKTHENVVNDGLQVGDNVTIRDTVYAFTDSNTTYVNRSSGSGECLVCGWDHGDGSVYYTTNVSVTAETAAAYNLTRDTVYEESAVAGLPLVRGTSPENAQNVAVARRPVLIETTNLYERGTVRLVLWQ